ncbi:hypothetical protein JKG47_15730 [Acidithiobacillus sp. MC6.1]|nr:hypothetical protein [Acidithiobacillus sp. MC6.1]
MRNVDSIYLSICEKLSTIDALLFIKINNERISASNNLSINGKKEPIVEMGAEGIVGVDLIIDIKYQVVQFYTITSAVKGFGKQMVSAVIEGTPQDWQVVVLMDWSSGFWTEMLQTFPRLVVF